MLSTIRIHFLWLICLNYLDIVAQVWDLEIFSNIKLIVPPGMLFGTSLLSPTSKSSISPSIVAGVDVIVMTVCKTSSTITALCGGVRQLIWVHSPRDASSAFFFFAYCCSAFSRDKMKESVKNTPPYPASPVCIVRLIWNQSPAFLGSSSLHHWFQLHQENHRRSLPLDALWRRHIPEAHECEMQYCYGTWRDLEASSEVQKNIKSEITKVLTCLFRCERIWFRLFPTFRCTLSVMSALIVS